MSSLKSYKSRNSYHSSNHMNSSRSPTSHSGHGHGQDGHKHSHRSRVKKQHHQYLTFLRKWKSFVHNQQYQACQQLCLEHIERINKAMEFNRQQNINSEELYRDLRSYRSKVRNLYAVLLHDHLKQHDTALDQYEKCIEDDPSNASAHYNWAILYKNYYHDYETAATHYKQAILLKPDHAAYHNNYGLLLEQQLKRYDEAKEEFQHALKLDPTNGRAHTNMANLLKKQYKNYKEAAKHYQEAIQLDHKNPTRHFNYALFLKHNLKDYNGAAEEYERALDLDPNYQQAHKEYLTFLLTESPLHRRKKQKRNRNGSRAPQWLDPNSQSQTYEPTMDELHEHAERCIRYAIKLMWKSKFAESKDILSMALRCDGNHRVARLLSIPNDPRAREIDPYYLQQELSRHIDYVNDKNDQMKHAQEKLNNFQLKVSEMATHFLNGGTNGNEHSRHPQWAPNQLASISTSMKEEVTRLEGLTESNTHNNFYNGGSGSGGSFRYGMGMGRAGAGVSKKGAPSDQPSMVADTASSQRGSKYGGRGGRTGAGQGKRSSVISVSSVNTDYENTYRLYDFQKNTLANAITQLDNIVTSSRDLDLMHSLSDVKAMVESSLSSLVQNQPQLTAKFLTIQDGGGASSTYGGYTTGGDAQTLGAMSMVSTTSSAAMEQRKNFLKEAYNNPDVPMADRAVARWLTHEYLQPKRAPASVLSSGHLPTFAEDPESDNATDDDDTMSVKEAKRSRRKEQQQKKQQTQGSSRQSRVVARVDHYRKNDKCMEILKKRNEWDFDVFAFVDACSNQHCLAVLMCILCDERTLSEELEINMAHLCNYYVIISNEYLDNPYHNRTHGCDVLMNTHYYLQAKIFQKLPPLAQFSCLMAAACHDVGHPGTNNDFQIHTESEFAITYNDEAVLENYHVALSWRTLQKQGCNFMEGWNKKDRRGFRRFFIGSILGTDMGKHKAQQGTLTDLIDHLMNNGVDLQQLEEDEDDGPGAHDDPLMQAQDQIDNQAKRMSRSASVASIPPTSVYADPIKLAEVALPLIVHTADLTNAAKPFALYDQWATRIVTEFFAQGDRERKLNIPVSNVCDRHKTDKPTVQTGFINFIIKPWFAFWARLLTDRDQGPLFQENIETNFKIMNQILSEKRERDAADANLELAQQNREKSEKNDTATGKGGSNAPGDAASGKKGNGNVEDDRVPSGARLDNDSLDESKVQVPDNSDTKSQRSVSFQSHQRGYSSKQVASGSAASGNSNRKARYKRAQSDRHLLPDSSQDGTDNGGSAGAANNGGHANKVSGSRSPSFYNNIFSNPRTAKAMSIVAIPFEDIARVQHKKFAQTLQMAGNNVNGGDYSVHSGNDDSEFEVVSTHSQDNVLEDYASDDPAFYENGGNNGPQNGHANGHANGQANGNGGGPLQNIPEEPNAKNMV